MNFDCVVQFIKANWKIIAAAVLWLISFIVLCCKKKVKSVSDVVTLAFQSIPSLVVKAEEKFGAGKGVSKKEFVLESVYLMIESATSFSRFEIVSRYGSTIEMMIEDILTAPVKKGN